MLYLYKRPLINNTNGLLLTIRACAFFGAIRAIPGTGTPKTSAITWQRKKANKTTNHQTKPTPIEEKKQPKKAKQLESK